MSSNALNKNTQLKTRNTPQANICMVSFLFHFSLLYCPVTNQHNAKNKVAQIQRTNTNSKDGKPVCTEKNPIDPKIDIERIIFIAGIDFE
jgi:hypothetical protein